MPALALRIMRKNHIVSKVILRELMERNHRSV